MSEKNHSNLVIIGKGELEYQLKTLAKELRIESRVNFMGSQKHDKIPLCLNTCDVFCLPSRNEGFPTVIVEPNNTEDLAATLNKALEKEWDYQALAEYGKRFSWNTIAEKYSELYKNVASKK